VENDAKHGVDRRGTVECIIWAGTVVDDRGPRPQVAFARNTKGNRSMRRVVWVATGVLGMVSPLGRARSVEVAHPRRHSASHR
jgi:hypothetical protein